MKPSSPDEPASPPADPATSSQPLAAPVGKPAKDSGQPPVKPDDASENAQGNEIHEEDLELTDATASDPSPGNAKQDS
ncbi:hypothetical protein D3C86_781740 [compost metagenome]